MELTKKEYMVYGKLAVQTGIISEAEYYRLYDEFKAHNTKTKKTKDETEEMIQMFNRLPDDILSEEE